jgi:hypothetical protein
MTLLPVLIIALKLALIAFVVGGIIALIAHGVRRSRANSLDPRWNDHRTQPGYEASTRGVMHSTPLPEWAYWDDDGDDDPDDDETHQHNVRVTPLR